MAALLSGDPHLMEVYQNEGRSLHLETAEMVFPDKFCPDFKKKYHKDYVACKSLNFLVIFKGGPTTYQTTLRHDSGIEVTFDFCAKAIRAWYDKHPVYKKWQDSIIDLAAEQGYLELPTGWSRTFGLGHQNISGQMGEVCNFMHQTPCCQITQSAQYQIYLDFLKYRLRSLICLNIYDAVFVDIYRGEEQAVDGIVDRALTRPPLLPVFERWVGRTVPWVYEKKEYK